MSALPFNALDSLRDDAADAALFRQWEHDAPERAARSDRGMAAVEELIAAARVALNRLDPNKDAPEADRLRAAIATMEGRTP